MNTERQLPNIGAPAMRALNEAGFDLDDVKRADLDQLATLDGVGPRAISALRAALET